MEDPHARVVDAGDPAELVGLLAHLVDPGDRMVITAGTSVNIPGTTNLIKVDIA